MLCLMLSIALFSCGNEIVPQGGPKDLNAPIIEIMDPPNNSTHFKGREFKIQFDEFIKVINAKENIFVSPPLNSNLKAVVKGKRLYISTTDTLQDSITYIFNFRGAVKDNHEGTKLDFFNYTLSTGDYIDSLTLNGKIEDAYTGKPIKKVLLILHKDTSDSAFQLLRPQYIASSDEFGKFQFTNLKAGKYFAYALQDQNKNYRFDLKKENIAFTDSIIIVNDSTDSIHLRLFQEVNQHFFLSKTFSKGLGHFILLPNLVSDSMLVSILDSNFTHHSFSVSYGKDSIHLWINGFINDTLSFVLKTNNQVIDTIEVGNAFLALDSIKKVNETIKTISSHPEKIIQLDKELRFFFNQPIDSLFERKICMYENKVKVSPSRILISNNRLSFSIKYNWKYESNYEFDFKDSAFHNFYGQVNDSVNYKLRTYKEGVYSSLKLNFKTPDTLNIIELIKGKKPVDTFYVQGIDSVMIPYLLDGEYKLRIIEDVNHNKIWDSGDFSKRTQPEKVYWYPETIQIPKNFDVEQLIEL